MGCDFSVDDLDFFIISEISQGNDSTWEIAKKYFELEKSNKYEVTSKNMLVKNRIQKMSEWGLFNISKEKNGWKNEYQLIKEHFHIGKHKFPDGYFDSIQLKINDSWVIFQR